ncbi:MAG: ATP synthase subunit I [Gammaproteobacteria bacterium]|nr:ATP synthase subunit I [Gammaproteobacteria bacterium]
MTAGTKTALIIIATQLVLTLLISALLFGLYDLATAVAGLAGGAISMITTAFLSAKLFLRRADFAADRFLRRLFAAEIQKIALTVILLYIGIVWLRLAPMPLIVTFMVSLMAYWLALPFLRTERYLTGDRNP